MPRPFRPFRRTVRPVLAVALLGAWVPLARADDEGPSRFAVVDVSAIPSPARLVAEVEREVARLRPQLKPIEDESMRRTLASGEGPVETVARLAGEARRARSTGDCPGAERRAREGERIAISSVAAEEERELLVDLYTTLVLCAHDRNDPEALKAAAVRLRALTPSPPPAIPVALWDEAVAGATPPPGTVELFIDSEPGNAQVRIDLRGEGVTPRTLKVAPGEHDIEVYKDGYLKAYRRLKVGSTAARTVFRLVERTRDRHDQAASIARLLRKDGVAATPGTLAQLAQLARADVLVILSTEGTRVGLAFFDAERGAVSPDRITSSFDPATGRIAVLAARETPGEPPSGKAADQPLRSAGVLAPVGQDGKPRPASAAPVPPPPGLAESTPPPPTRGREREGPPWWSWVIAAGIGVAIGLVVWAEQPDRQTDLDVRARWTPPPGP